MPNAPHRRDRRRAPLSVPGGQCQAINTLFFDDVASSTDGIVFQMVLYDATNAPTLARDEGAKENADVAREGWMYIDGVTPVNIDVVSVSPTGQVVLSLAEDRTVAGSVTIPSFNPDLRGLSGSVNAGGIIYIPAP